MALKLESLQRQWYQLNRVTRRQLLRLMKQEAGTWLIGIGSFGTKQAQRITQQAGVYGALSDLLLVTLIELDVRIHDRVVKSLGAGVPIVAPTADELSDAGVEYFREGFERATMEEVWAARDLWIPSVESVLERSILAFQDIELLPAEALIELSPGGHAVVGLYAVYYIAQRMPHTRRVAITVVPEAAESVEAFIEFLSAMEPIEGALA